jgi:hypothetical protein
MASDETLILAAAKIARTAPGDWKQFLGAFQEYSSKQISNCVASPLDELPRAQGRAQATAHLYGLLAECVSSADKIEGKRK